MVRPKFLNHFLGRLPDVRSLRFRALAGVGAVAGSFGLLLLLAAVQLDARRCAESARVEAETLARTAGLWLDGDAHAGLGTAPEKRLSDLAATLETLLESSAYPGIVRTLRPKAEVKAVLAGAPKTARTGALEVVLQTGKSNVVRKDVDYRPEMAAALIDGHTISFLAHGQIAAYAPVKDSWGATTALVWVSGPATAPLWRRAAFFAGSLVFVALLVSLTVWLGRRASERAEQWFAALDSGVRQLIAGRASEPIALPPGAPSELVALSEALETLRARMEAQANGQPMPAAPVSAADEQRSALLGEPAEFDLALLFQQLADPARKMAHTRRVELQLVYPDGVPSQLVGHPVVLFRTLDALLKNSLRNTSQGRITLRVQRAGEATDGEKLRFEVADTSPGITFKDQQDLGASLAQAALADPQTLREPLQLASSLAHQLGGELTFESQPGQGSRFGFTLTFAHGPQPAPRTGFHPQQAATGFRPQATGFHPQAASAFQTGASVGPPQSSFQPRPKLRSR